MSNLKVSISIDTLIAWTCLIAGVAILFVTAMGALPERDGFAGMAFSIVGAIVYFSGRLERMDARERQAFELGRESAGGGVRTIRP